MKMNPKIIEFKKNLWRLLIKKMCKMYKKIIIYKNKNMIKIVYTWK